MSKHPQLIQFSTALLALFVCWATSVFLTQNLISLRDDEQSRMVLTADQRGVGSMSAWAEVVAAVTQQELDRMLEQESSKDLLREATEQLLYTAIDDYRSELRRKARTSNSLGAALEATTRSVFMEALIDVDTLRGAVPGIAEKFANDLSNGSLNQKLEAVVSGYLEDLGGDLSNDGASARTDVLKALGCTTVSMCLDSLERRASESWTAVLSGSGIMALALVVLVVLEWRRGPASSNVTNFYILSIAALALLLPAVVAPMLKLSAQIDPVELTMGGKIFSFDAQLIVFQNKSIWNLVKLMVDSGQIALLLLAIGMLLFCIILPISKTVAAAVLLYRTDRGLGCGSPLRWLALDSSKWSMVDVLVVAIMMSYIGMNQLISAHIDALKHFIQQTTLLSASASSTLDIGFYFFVSFVGFSFLLAHRCKARLEVNNRISSQIS